MIVHVLRWHRAHKISRARSAFERAYSESIKAEERGDTRRQHTADAALRVANINLLRVELGQ